MHIISRDSLIEENMVEITKIIIENKHYDVFGLFEFKDFKND